MDDTQQLIAQLTQMKTAADGQSAALDKAIGILGGTLASQALDLENKYQKQIADLKAQIDILTAANIALSTPVVTPPDIQPLQ